MTPQPPNKLAREAAAEFIQAVRKMDREASALAKKLKADYEVGNASWRSIAETMLIHEQQVADLTRQLCVQANLHKDIAWHEKNAERLEQQIQAKDEALREAKKDSERLDWLEANPGDIRSHTGGGWSLEKSLSFPTLREAIDEAVRHAALTDSAKGGQG